MGKECKKETKWSIWYDSYLSRWIPAYAFPSLVGCFVFNCLLYWGTQSIIIGLELNTYDITSAVDNMIPFRPGWVLIYVLSFPFWVISYTIVARETKREEWFRFVFADMLAKTICGIIFIVFPTTNVRPEIDGSGIMCSLMNFIYLMDQPLNLFPSIHCMVSMLCWLGIRKCDNIPLWYRNITLVFAILIFASTQFTKQHYIVDVFGGVALALVCYFIGERTKGYKVIENGLLWWR